MTLVAQFLALNLLTRIYNYLIDLFDLLNFKLNDDYWG